MKQFIPLFLLNLNKLFSESRIDLYRFLSYLLKENLLVITELEEHIIRSFRFDNKLQFLLDMHSR